VTDVAEQAHPNARWRAAADLIWTHYDDGDDWVVYVPASADMHLLTASAYRLWTLISSSQSSSSNEVAARLAAELSRPLNDELMTATLEAIAFMDHAGLVRPVSP
jgi:PqqD family protein of HPr-rel-A system